MEEDKIAALLSVAKDELLYCKIIVNYPVNAGRKHYDVLSKIDNFYKSTCNVFFHDTLLIIGSLLNKKWKDTISLWNYKDFVKQKGKELKTITDDFSKNSLKTKSSLKTIRDEVIAHQVVGNKANLMPGSRRRGIIRLDLIEQLQEVLDKIIEEFCNYSSEFKTPFSEQYFDITIAKEEIELILSKAKPTLTDSDVI